MPGRIELHYSPNFNHLFHNFLSYYPNFLKNINSFIYLVPEANRAAYLSNKHFCPISGKALLKNPFLKHMQFYLMIFEKLALPGKYLQFSERCQIIQKILLDQSNHLQYFKYSNRNFPIEIIQNLQNLFDEVRLTMAEANILSGAGEWLSLNTSDKFLDDLKFIFKEYMLWIGQDYLDEAGIKKAVCENISKSFLQKYFSGLETVIIENVSRFKKFDLQFIKTLKKFGIQIYLIFPYGRNGEIFNYKTHLFNKLRSVADHVQGYENNDKLSNALFQIMGAKLDLANRISLLHAIDKQAEVERIAGEIKKLVIDESIRYSQIAVSSPQLYCYKPVIETVFSRYQIPYNFSEGKKLGHSIVLKNVLLLVELVLQNYPTKIFRNLLKSSLFSYRQNLNVAQMERIFAGIRVKSGRSEILEYLKKEKSYALERAEDKETDKEFTDIENLIKVIQKIIKESSYLQKPRRANEYFTYFFNLVKRHKISQIRLDREVEKNIISGEEIILALNSFFENLNFWREINIKSSPNKKYTLQQFLQVLSLIMNQRKIKPHRFKNYGVQILPLSTLADHPRFAVFMAGMKEGAFPRRFTEGVFIPQSRSKLLEPLLPGDQFYKDRELFLGLLHLTAKKVYFSYPSFQQDDPVLPSLFIRELERISTTPLYKDSSVPLFTGSQILAKLNESRSLDSMLKENRLKISESLQSFVTPDILNFLRYRLGIFQKRILQTELTRWEGNLNDEPIVLSWLDKYYRNARYSPTQLEVYAKCPMIFFFERLLNSQQEQEIEEYLSAQERGIAIHNTLFRFYHDLSHEKRTIGELLLIAQNELDKIPAPHNILWMMEKEFYLGNKDQKGLLHKFLDYENDLALVYRTIPKHFELSFGNPIAQIENTDPASTTDPFVVEQDGVKYQFKGKIDRIEVSEDGTVLVVDYKTGGVPTLKEMWEGEKLQLPLYLAAVRQILSSHYKKLKLAGGAFYRIKNEKELGKRVVFIDKDLFVGKIKIVNSAKFPNDKYTENDTPVTLDQFLNRILSFSIGNIKAIQAGHFQHTINRDKCERWGGTSCGYLPLCRVSWYKQSMLSLKQGEQSSH